MLDRWALNPKGLPLMTAVWDVPTWGDSTARLPSGNLRRLVLSSA